MSSANEILAKLAEVAVDFVTEMKSQLERVNAPDNERQSIKDSIITDSPIMVSEGRYQVTVRIPLSGRSASAAALEWGSGLRATRGEASEYPIEGNPDLNFPKEDWPNYEPPPPAPDVFEFQVVMHPGIAPRPYIAPSIEKIKPMAITKLSQEIVSMVSITGKGRRGKNTEVVVIKS